MTAESSASNPTQNYIAIIGDLRHSRRVEDRAELQNGLLATVRRLNADLSSSSPQKILATPISMTAGDEVQALLNAGHFRMSLLTTLNDAAMPSEFTFGIGFGAISTDLNDNVALIDGPAFHNARAALGDARRTGCWAMSLGFGNDDEPIIGLLGLLGAVRARWTPRQRYFIEQVQSGQTQSAVAGAEGISPSVISESLRAAAHVPYLNGEAGVEMLISQHGAGR